MTRRDFAKLALVATLSLPRAVAQAAERTRGVGMLVSLPLSDPEVMARIVAFRKHLAELGWIEDRNIRFEIRSSNGEPGARQALARELVDLKLDAILGASSVDTAALLRFTRTIPIVFVTAADPLGNGFVQSLARPGGNVTGFTNSEDSMGSKWLELLKEIAPRIVRVGVLFNPATTPGAGTFFMQPLLDAGRALGVEVAAARVTDIARIESSFASVAGKPDAGLILLPDSFTVGHRKMVVALAARHRVPAIYPFRYFVDDGGLMSYGVDLEEPALRAAGYVDLILRGASPAELPVQSPRKYQLLINLRAAKALGLTVPAVLLARADQIIG